MGIYLPCYDIFRNFLEEFTSQNAPSMTPYVPLVAGSVARSLACITCYPVELARTRMQVINNIVSCFDSRIGITYNIHSKGLKNCDEITPTGCIIKLP